MASKDDIIAELRRIVDAQAKQIDTLTKRITELELKLAKAQKNSSNSSKSPSSDIVKPPLKKQSAAGKGRKAKISRILVERCTRIQLTKIRCKIKTKITSRESVN